MPQTLTYGQNTFSAYSRTELNNTGYTVNHNMWLGDGWFFCKVCKRDTPHYAMSPITRRQECVEVCRECDNYSGPQQIVNQPVEVISNGQNTSS